VRRLRLLCHAGLVAVFLAWIVIGLSWYLNRGWFRFTGNAFSDLGGARSCCPSLYNLGLIVVGLFLAAFSVCAAALAPGRLGAIGGGYLFIAAVFLALIGLFPTGTRPHTCVSTWFFVQSDLGFILLLAGLRRDPRCRGFLAGSALTASILAFPVAGLVAVTTGWPSVAVLEAYGILIIDYAAVAAWWCLIRRKPV
jgi:hypothetical membrane protein